MHFQQREPAVRDRGANNAYIQVGQVDELHGRAVTVVVTSVFSLPSQTVAGAAANPVESSTTPLTIKASSLPSSLSVHSTSSSTARTSVQTSSAASSTSASHTSSTQSSLSKSLVQSSSPSTQSSLSKSLVQSSSPSSASVSSIIIPPITSVQTSSAANMGAVAPTGTGAADTTTGNSTSLSSKKQSGVSPGAIGAIVTILLLAVLAIAFLLIRKRYVQRRQKRRNTWGAGFLGATAPDFSSTEKGYEHARLGNRTPSIRSVESASGNEASFYNRHPEAPTTYAAAQSITPPSMSYNNPLPLTSPALASPSLSVSVGAAASAALVMQAVVRCTFIPTLPDELSISTGETVRVMSEYDDGWSLCMNARGEQGMVPLECLERRTRGSAYNGQSTGDWTQSSKRVSSLSTRNGQSGMV